MYSFDLHKKLANENSFYRNPFLVLQKKMLGDGQIAIRYEISCHVTVGSNNKVPKVHAFGVDSGERHLFGIGSTVVIENQRFYI